MITVEEAKRIMMQHVLLRDSEYRLLQYAAGRVLAEDAIAPHDHPLFDMSAVDGYALGDVNGPWELKGSVAAGETLGRAIRPGECVRIFTGAHVPTDVYAVVMQERCTMQQNVLIIEGGVAVSGANIRRKGEGSRTGDVLLRKGSRLDPAGVGLLASCGSQDIPVAMAPTVSIVRTGGEFVTGDTLQPGRIFSSNERMLFTALERGGYRMERDAILANDTEEELRAAMIHAVEEGDMVITTGGASVGDHDLIHPVLESLGATIHFHGVAQKPGKPMLFATLKNTPVFALPGNPRAVLVCWYEYVLPFLNAMCGADDPWLRSDLLPLTHPLTMKGDRAEFRAAHVHGGKVTLLPDEGSHMLGSLTQADALAYFPQDVLSLREGDPVEVHFLPR